jgi:hypothetical protein
VEVKIGVQHASRELLVETEESTDTIEKLVTEALASGGVLALTDAKGRRTVVPIEKLAYVEIGNSTVGQVGFRS